MWKAQEPPVAAQETPAMPVEGTAAPAEEVAAAAAEEVATTPAEEVAGAVPVEEVAATAPVEYCGSSHCYLALREEWYDCGRCGGRYCAHCYYDRHAPGYLVGGGRVPKNCEH